MPRPASAPRKAGLWGVIRLDGAPVDAADAAACGLCAGNAAQPYCLQGHDSVVPAAVQWMDDAGGQTLLVGHIAGAAAMRARLGLATDTPPALLARAALAACGTETPAELLGDWSLLHRDADRHVTLMSSATRRDVIFFMHDGDRVAVAPDPYALTRLPGARDAIDEAGLLMGIGRAELRTAIGWRTMFQAVAQVPAGGSVTFVAGQTPRRAIVDVLRPQPCWQGSAMDALAETERLLLGAMRDRLAAERHPAIFLSGGLDSTLVAWLVAMIRSADQPVSCITSAAPPGSGIADEVPFAAMVAERLGLTLLPVAPPDDANPYRPPVAILAGSGLPPMSNRHCLTEAFEQAGQVAGATLFLNGTYGEFSVTARVPAGDIARRAFRAFRGEVDWLLGGDHRQRMFDPFHVQLAPHRLAQLPEAVREQLRAPRAARPPRSDLYGYLPGLDKGLTQPGSFYAGSIPTEYPFRDLRLLRHFAGLPVAQLREIGVDRGAVRRLLTGQVPDAIRLRQRGMPADPGGLRRLQSFAPAAQQRIAHLRRAGAGEWIDLDWLDTELRHMMALGVGSVDDYDRIQLTAMAAEFMAWHVAGRPDD
jgi:asparagine synthase (glutamine-hydrolysing)